MPTLTVIIPTYNEADYIKDALQSVAFADQIIVVDSFSTDATVEIAKPLASNFISRKFDNFSAQKNAALEHATGDWVLFIDADERVTRSLEAEIKCTLENPKHSGYKINFPHFFMTRFLYFQSNDVLRLVQRKGAHFTGLVHEKLHCNGSVGKLKQKMIHYTYKGLHHYITKKEKYAWFQAQQRFEKNKKTTYFHLFFKPSYRFFDSFIKKGGFRNGVPGLVLAAVDSYGVFSRYVKLILLQKGMK
ncbi:glycosyltransferase family 2 protein [Ulvibacter litoralis]|uniref:Glycosyltransferase involved in cell wall bisynthesis n=1 Tax=Ulvibacter litoralis TaxID=227084 RepID=A0A1G7EPW7_9FLAO|nr:glycosyltransferase family 2 protein [Ulvibacter litoralis]GHC54378.1 beta 1,4 glucosyltransferase [Ulvibacter litoralis]SDE65435.1 Glycosyltransferase involved in cell wall bisynthesis [Ulvibacter litoralis]